MERAPGAADAHHADLVELARAGGASLPNSVGSGPAIAAGFRP
jgi:hypothetical protein